MRIGFGNDIHRLVTGRPLVIGGVTIPSDKGEEAHSDGDVLIHAIIDSILGAKALGDIGALFPPSDAKWKNADSRELLKAVLELSKPDIINIDATITLERPKLRGYIEEIRKELSKLLDIDISQVSIKAKTNEGLGDIGSGNAIKAECVILLN